MDVEGILTGIEKTEAYRVLHSVLCTEKIESRKQIAHLACFVVFQHVRGHAMLKAMLESTETLGIERFEYFWLLKHVLGNADLLYRLSVPIATRMWTFYRTSEHVFPLPDTPVLVSRQNIMIALSPTFLAEVDFTRPRPEGDWVVKDGVSASKLREYRRRAISNTFKEIIFSNKSILEQWRQTKEFKQRVRQMADIQSYNGIVAETPEGQLWKINAFANTLE